MSTSLSTHVLDTGHGEPAHGVLVELFLGDELVATGVTGADGRIAELRSPSSSREATTSSSTPRPTSSRVLELELALGNGHFHVPAPRLPLFVHHLPRQLSEPRAR